ncbi:hypothetical protein NX059_002967 [Plenodomus lindquistii]|nr:hypothetical protein NX059_002967 [Plenodomus lindquistii]
MPYHSLTPRDLPTPSSQIPPPSTPTTLPTHSKAGSNAYTDTIAGIIIALIALFIFSLFFYTSGIPWLRAWPARVALIKAQRRRRNNDRDNDDDEANIATVDYARPNLNSKLQQPETCIPLTNLDLPPRIRLADSGLVDRGNLQAGIERVKDCYERELRMGRGREKGRWGVGGEGEFYGCAWAAGEERGGGWEGEVCETWER